MKTILVALIVFSSGTALAESMAGDSKDYFCILRQSPSATTALADGVFYDMYEKQARALAKHALHGKAIRKADSDLILDNAEVICMEVNAEQLAIDPDISVGTPKLKEAEEKVSEGFGFKEPFYDKKQAGNADALESAVEAATENIDASFHEPYADSKGQK